MMNNTTTAPRRARVSIAEANAVTAIVRQRVLEGTPIKVIASEVDRSDSFTCKLVTHRLGFRNTYISREEVAMIQAHRAKQGITFTP
jgi:hypothetical protein